MHWQKAVQESDTGLAIRGTADKVMFRQKDGSGTVCDTTKHTYRDAIAGEMEGFLDWSPYKNEVLRRLTEARV